MISFFFNDPATTEISALSLHDTLPISTSTEPLPLMRNTPLLLPIEARPTAKWSIIRKRWPTSTNAVQWMRVKLGGWRVVERNTAKWSIIRKRWPTSTEQLHLMRKKHGP